MGHFLCVSDKEAGDEKKVGDISIPSAYIVNISMGLHLEALKFVSVLYYMRIYLSLMLSKMEYKIEGERCCTVRNRKCAEADL